MPTTYAHYTFGKNVLEKLDDVLRKNIEENVDLYNIGLHGPDLLFYYKPLSSNKINQLGGEIHKTNANLFFEKAKDIILWHEHQRKAISYIAGFICHYMLDSQCHPYIREKETLISHNEIEAEFDRALMLKDELNPITFKPTFHLVPNKENAECISKFFPSTSADEILSSIKSMKFYLNLLVAPGRFQRSIITWALKISGNENKTDLIKKYSPREDVNSINEELMKLYNEAIDPAAIIIKEYFQNIHSKEKLNERFNRTFG